ncbi:MAG: murein biosynthesis integral membrane protein MurJ [Chthoniobacteraceae bacterium]
MAEGSPRTGKATAIVGAAVLCSRLLGLVREILFNALFGTKTLGYFLIAFRVPNLLRDLFAEGALSTAFITVFSKKIATEGEGSAWRLANRVGTLTLSVMSVITVLGMIFAPQLIGVLAGGFTGEDAKLTAQLTTVMFPFILLVSLAAQVMGMLNAKHVFGWPAMASSFFNIGSIVGGIALARWMDGGFGRHALFGLAWGTLIGGFLQLTIQFPSLRRIGYHPRLDFHWRDSGVAEVLRTMAPAVVAASAVQVNVLVNTSFATDIGSGAVTWLNNAFRLMQLPLGMFGVAIGTVALPLLSRSAALGNRDEFREALSRGIRLVFFLTVPASVGLWMLSEPILSVIYQHNKVTWNDVVQSAGALRYYAIGLAAYAGMKVLAPAFYAIGRRKTPMMISFIAMGLNYGLNSYFTKHGYGHRGLALSTGVVALTNFGLLYWCMRREIATLETRRLLVVLVKVFLASDALALVCWGGKWLLLDRWQTMGLLLRMSSLGLTIALALGAFCAVAAMLGLHEMHDLLDAVRRKLSRRSVRPASSGEEAP